MGLRNYITMKRIWELAIVVLILIAAFWVWQSYSSLAVVERTIDLLKSLADRNPILAFGLFFVFSMVSTMLSPFSTIPIVPVAVLLWGEAATFFLLTLGWISGGSLAYLIGRHVGYPVVTKLISKRRTDYWLKYASEHMTFPIAFLFRAVTPSETGYIFGLVKFDFWKYLLITAITETVFAVPIVWASDAFLENNILEFAQWILFLVVVFALAFYIFNKKTRAHRVV